MRTNRIFDDAEFHRTINRRERLSHNRKDLCKLSRPFLGFSNAHLFGPGGPDFGSTAVALPLLHLHLPRLSCRSIVPSGFLVVRKGLEPSTSALGVPNWAL